MLDFYVQESDDELLYGEDDLFGEDGSEGEEQLSEGVLSSFFAGTDDDNLKKLQKQLKDGITAREQEKMLDEIDEMIDNSNRIFTSSSFGKAIADLGLFGLTSGLGYVIKVVYRAVNGDRESFRDACFDLRNMVKAAKAVKG